MPRLMTLNSSIGILCNFLSTEAHILHFVGKIKECHKWLTMFVDFKIAMADVRSF